MAVNSLKNFKITGLLFVALTITLTTALHNRSNLKQFFSLANKTITRPYFNALVTSNVNLSTVARKIRKLPGVELVKVKTALDVKEELGSLKSELDSDVLESLAGINYSSLTIEMGRSLQVRSQDLIKEYLTRLVGKDSVTISDIKTPETIKIKKNDPYLFVNDWGDIYIIAILAIVWLGVCLSFAKYLKNYSYLIEKFQRKSNVGLKIFATGFALVAVVSLLINLYFRPYLAIGEWLFLFLLFSSSLFIFGKKIEYKKLV